MEYSGWFVMLLGMGTVFFGLVCLIFITMAMSFFIKKGEGKVKSAPIEVAKPAVAASAPIVDRPQFVAAISAAIATSMGTDISGIRIHSIRPVGAINAPERQELVAAVSAAIATEMGCDIEGLRIHSIRPV